MGVDVEKLPTTRPYEAWQWRVLQIKRNDGGNMSYKYRKKPVVIEAFRLGHDDPPQWWQDALDLYRSWIRDSAKKDLRRSDLLGRAAHYFEDGAIIYTLEGSHRARKGDFIIRGVEGELYHPCKYDIFWKTYEIALLENEE